jgi:glycerate 2-kinase
MPHVVAAPDKFRGTATAHEVAAAVAAAAHATGWTVDEVPVSDGGEGFREVFAGRRHPLRVAGPLGQPVEAEWRMLDDGRTAVIEMAEASGLTLAGGPAGNDPMNASTAGTGELIADAVKAGAKRILLGVGGSASTDGGLGALDVLEPHARLAGVEIRVACDVETRFVDAAAVFAPQKGATPSQVRLLTRRLERLAQLYLERFGVDVTDIVGGGAAGGLAGGLAAIGATLGSGIALVAEVLELSERIEGADLVVTGEGFLDEESFHGKAVGGVVALAAEAGVPVLVVAGDVLDDPPVPYRSLVARYGLEAAFAETTRLITEIVAEELAALA